MDALTLGELEQLTRRRLRDFGKSKPRWASETIFDALNEAQREAAYRGRLLRDDVFDAATKVDVVAGTAVYNLHPSVFDVVGATLDSKLDNPLELVTLDHLNAMDRAWRTRTGTPHSYLITQMPNEQLRLQLINIPIIDDVLRLDVYRMPMDSMTEADFDTPEIAPRHQHGLIDWAMYRCYSETDPDLYDPVKAAEHLAAFENRFGLREDANVQRLHRERHSMSMTPR